MPSCPYLPNLSYGPCQAKKCLQTCAKCAHSNHPAHVQSIIRGLWSPFIQSVVSDDSASGQWRPWSDCADAQSDLELRCPHMPEDTFSHGTSHTAKDNKSGSCSAKSTPPTRSFTVYDDKVLYINQRWPYYQQLWLTGYPYLPDIKVILPQCVLRD